MLAAEKQASYMKAQCLHCLVSHQFKQSKESIYESQTYRQSGRMPEPVR